MSEAITVIFEEITCEHDTKETGHDDVYFHVYRHHE